MSTLQFTKVADKLSRVTSASKVPDRILVDSKALCSFTHSVNAVLDRVAQDDLALTAKNSNRP